MLEWFNNLFKQNKNSSKQPNYFKAKNTRLFISKEEKIIVSIISAAIVTGNRNNNNFRITKG